MSDEIKLQETNSEAEETKVEHVEAVTESNTEAQELASGSNAEVEQAMSQMTGLKKGDTVKGKIVKVEDNEAYVDIAYKYDGIIPLREISSVGLESAGQGVQVGQEVELKVLSIDDAKEKLLLSKRVVDSEKAWETLQQDMENRTIIEATVAEVVKGGLVVDVGLRGFVPASMVERQFVEDFSDYKGRTLRLRVKELDREKNKVILSQKDVLDEEFEAMKQEKIAGIKAGQEFTGTVQRIAPFGAFIDIGGIDGLVHISEMAWQHVQHPSDVVKEGDQVKVVVLKVEPEKDKISLSMKATQPGPWDKAEETFKSGD